MPEFDLRYMKVAEYHHDAGVVSYTNKTSAGEAITALMQLAFSEGRLFAESRLAEYLKKATGGTISIGVKYIPVPAQKVMFDAKETARTINAKEIKGYKYTGLMAAKYVGFACYAPDMIDNVEKYTCIFVPKALFGPPATQLQTLNGNTITFNTPTTSGEFMLSDEAGKDLIEYAVVDDTETAEAWVDAVLGGTS